MSCGVDLYLASDDNGEFQVVVEVVDNGNLDDWMGEEKRISDLNSSESLPNQEILRRGRPKLHGQRKTLGDSESWRIFCFA